MRKKIKINWKKHLLTYHSSPTGRVHILKQPNTSDHSVIFINSMGVMSVTGDFGNWIFCREFHPSPGAKVSEAYWVEKLKIASTQQPMEFDPDETRKQLRKEIREIGTNGYDPDTKRIIKGYYENCLAIIDDGNYFFEATQEVPDGFDSEYVVYCEKPKIWLLCIFQAFNEICRRLEIEEKKQKKHAQRKII